MVFASFRQVSEHWDSRFIAERASRADYNAHLVLAFCLDFAVGSPIRWMFKIELVQFLTGFLDGSSRGRFVAHKNTLPARCLQAFVANGN